MQSLSAKTCVGSRLAVLRNPEARTTRTQRVSCPNRRNWSSAIVSCGSERNGTDGTASPGGSNGSFLSPSHNYAILKHRMEVAAKSEVSVFVLVFVFFKEEVFFCFFVFL